MELVAQMREYEREAEEPTLAGFLERITLASDVDSYDPEKGAVALMTVHTAKGLEFPEVLCVGLEEGVFPHQRSIRRRMRPPRKSAASATSRSPAP